MGLKILPGEIANMIAAGEVVQRPASVVKELMENAVDAGADRINVVIQDAGRTLIQVIDNGCGMSPDEAVLCFERHATSKIATAEDLMDIRTFGFRGEALASIAAVAQVTLRTRREEDEVGCEVVFAASRQMSLDEVSAPRGSNFMVRDLFYNIPARRKFLKSDNVEFKHIVSEFTKVALTSPGIGFSLNHNGRDVLSFKPAKSLKFRIQDLLGSNSANNVLDVSTTTSVVKVSGFVGRPESARKGLGEQYFFVNGRYFRSPYLHKAVMKAYENLIPEGVTPSYFLYLEVDPHTVDVNISPTKTEMKFEEESIIFQTIYASIKEALAKQSFGDSLDFNRDGAPEMPVLSSRYDEFRPVGMPSAGEDTGFNPFDNDGFPLSPDSWGQSVGGTSAGFAGKSSGRSDFDAWNQEGTTGAGNGWMPDVPADKGWSHEGAVGKQQDYGKLFEDKMMPSHSVLVTGGGRFIITAVKSGLMVINTRRAKERILYERFLDALSRNAHVTQTSLFPEQVQVGVENMLVIMDKLDMLQSLGFDIRPFGNDTLVVSGVPEGYESAPGHAAGLVADLLEIFKDGTVTLQETMTATMAAKLAAAGASAVESFSTTMQAQSLIDTLFACSNAEFTPSGHRTITIIPLDEIEKKF